ncbi:MAG: lanthionine synthetase LanC family protein [Bacteroidota bacterium]
MSAAGVIEEKIRLITNYYLSDQMAQSHPGELGALSEGAGSIIAKSLIYSSSTDELLRKTVKDSILSDLDLIYDTIENNTSLAATFSRGLAGTGWLLAYLKDLQIIDIDLNEFLEDIDEVLNIYLDAMIEADEFDILHGYMGIGIYFLKLNKYKQAERIVTALYNSKIDDGTEIKWKTIEAESGLPVLNFGLSHGNASILYFLGKCYSKGVCPAQCLELINGLFKFFFNNIQDVNVSCSYFPYTTRLKMYDKQPKPVQDSHLAWCYGDLGVLHTMYLVSGWIENDDISKKVLGMLSWETSRLDLQSNVIGDDASFCHGAAGVGYLFLNLYNKTGDNNFKKAASYWFDETVKMAKYTDECPHGFKFPLMDTIGFNDSVIAGLSGVFACLLSAQSKEMESSWNECFFLS